jgi:predicted ferric reductase
VDPTVWGGATFFRWRSALLQCSGVVAIGGMSLAMVLAVRPVWFESRLGGLDKMYRLHKWLGISALVLSVLHWGLAQGPKWAVGWGWRQGRGPRAEHAAGGVLQWLSTQRGLAEEVGEWAFYALLVLTVLALVKRVPYKFFVKTHHFLAVVYLALALHAVVLLRSESWRSALGAVMVVALSAGAVAAVLVLLRRNAGRRRVPGRVLAVRRHAPLDVVEVDLELQGRWPGHAAGQFAFVTLHRAEGAHPFTIATDWREDGRLTFLIKALGDNTRTLAGRTCAGDPVEVEGPYGGFTFESTQPHQIWVGAGIGIAPFVARLKTLAHQGPGQDVDLFHTTAVLDPEVVGLLEKDARDAGVALHLFWDERDGLLTGARITTLVPEWRAAEVWFCGPSAFGAALRRDLLALGLPAVQFHQELFELR